MYFSSLLRDELDRIYDVFDENTEIFPLLIYMSRHL